MTKSNFFEYLWMSQNVGERKKEWYSNEGGPAVTVWASLPVYSLWVPEGRPLMGNFSSTDDWVIWWWWLSPVKVTGLRGDLRCGLSWRVLDCSRWLLAWEWASVLPTQAKSMENGVAARKQREWEVEFLSWGARSLVRPRDKGGNLNTYLLAQNLV